MIVERRSLSANIATKAAPRWLRELKQYNRDANYNAGLFAALVSQTSCELRALDTYTTGGAQRVLINQQVRLCEKCLGRIERELADEPDLRASITDPLVNAALTKRATRREQALADEAHDLNSLQRTWNELLVGACRDVDLCRDLALQTNQSPAWGKKLGERMKATAIAMLAMLADETSAAIDTTMPPSVFDWLARSKIILEREEKKS